MSNWFKNSFLIGWNSAGVALPDQHTITQMNSSQTLSISHYIIELTNTTDITLTLPTAIGNAGRGFMFKRMASGNTTIATTLSQLIDGSSSFLINGTYQRVFIISNGSNWMVLFSQEAPVWGGLLVYNRNASETVSSSTPQVLAAWNTVVSPSNRVTADHSANTLTALDPGKYIIEFEADVYAPGSASQGLATEFRFSVNGTQIPNIACRTRLTPENYDATLTMHTGMRCPPYDLAKDDVVRVTHLNYNSNPFVVKNAQLLLTRWSG